MKLIALMLAVVFTLIACGKQEERFAGFTPIGADEKTTKFYIDSNTVKRSRKGTVSFNLIRVLSDGYVIQNAITDCKSSFESLEGVKYREDGTSSEAFAAETLALPAKDNADITALVTMTCDRSEENRVITGAFDNTKALEILRDPDQKSSTVKLLESKDFTQQGSTKHIVLFMSVLPDDPKKEVLNAGVFVKKYDNWIVENEYPYLKIINNDAMPKNVRWERIGNDNYGIIEELPDQVYMHELDAGLLKTAIHYQPPKKDNNVKNLGIVFFDTNKHYSSALAIVDYDNGDKAEQAFQFKLDRYVPLGDIALKELVDVSVELSKIWFEQSFQKNNDFFHVIFFKTSNRDSIFAKTSNRDSLVLFHDCHACGVKISVVTYKQQTGEWWLLSKQPNFDELGAFGDAPAITQAKTLELSQNNMAFLIEAGDVHFGVVDEWNQIFLFSKNKWSDIGSVKTGFYDDEYSKSSYKGKISVIPSKKEYPDLMVTKKGTEQDENQNVVPAKNAIYVFNSKEYEEKQQKNTVSSTPVSMPKNIKKSAEPPAITPQAMVMQMLEYASDDGGLSHEQEIQQTKLQIEALPKIEKGNKKAARAINERGLVFSKELDFNNAVKMFEEANKLDTSDIEIASNLGFAYLKQGNLDLAEQAIIATLTMSPSRATAWANLGEVYGAKGDARHAVACFSNTYRFSKDRLKTHQFMKNLNETEELVNVKQARAKAINWAEKSEGLLR